MYNMSLNTQIISTATIATVLAVFSAYIYYKKTRNRIPTKWTAVGKVEKLMLYPLKSGRRREVQSAKCTTYGLSIKDKNVELLDRCFVVYGENNNEFKTARAYPKLILIETSVNSDGDIVFTAPGQDQLVVKLPDSTSERVPISLQRKEPCAGLDCGNEAAGWLSTYLLNKPTGMRLGYHDGVYKRDIEKANPKFERVYLNLSNTAAGSYQDLTSYLLINKASVDELNKNLEEPISPNNFRPNILVEGENLPAFLEETWNWIKIGDAVFRNVKPCTRCILTTVDPEAGVLSKQRQPLKTLEKTNTLKESAHVKCEGKSPVMGIHLGLISDGYISAGDEVYVG